jgi:hypothetical protein
LALVGAATFIGCSSSGGSSDDTVSLVTQEGTFVDSPVQGLTYNGALSGLTNAGGHYSFQGTDRVEFLLGDKLKLGSLVPKTSNVSPLDFYDGQLLVTDTKIKILATLLQSLDANGDPSDGITILPETIAILEAALVGEDLESFDFTTLTLLELKTLLENVVAAAAEDDTTTEDDNMVVVDPDDATDNLTEELFGPQPPAADINGTALASCEGDYLATEDFASDYNASDTVKRNVSSSGTSEEEDYKFNKEDPTSHNSIERIGFSVQAKDANGTPLEPTAYFHPIVISYGQQVVGDFEMGDGSADIGDPTHRDALFFAVSLDNGDTWKNMKISNSEDKNSTSVMWDGDEIDYFGHIQKPSMAVEGNNILLAWNDKYCPSGNPFNLASTLDDDNKTIYPDDFFAVNGTQGSINYADENGTGLLAPNGKLVYEVPFSCVWTARGIMDETTGNVTWHRPMQLTSGVRDSNHIWIEGSEAGFAMTWQEDTVGLRSGKGAGPGEGWSGATTNRGSDIWYTSIKMDDFEATDPNATTSETSIVGTRAASLNNFHYPVRITDNEMCSSTDKKAYCKTLCTAYGSETFTTQNSAQTQTDRCYTYDVDMLDNTQVLLNGDTGASRPAIKILKTNEDENVVVLAYEETKGLTVRTPGEGDMTQGEEDTQIEFEGKSVYFESFNFNAIEHFNPTAESFDVNDINTSILATPMPLVSAGNIVNVKVPDQNDSSNMIYENARRVVIGTHVDSCKANQFTFALLYKQSFETMGESSDMFVRVNNGFTYDSFVPLSTGYGSELNVTNVSAQVNREVATIADYNVTWTEANLDDNTYENSYENTFSPRIFLRGDSGSDSGDNLPGDDIYVGFEYTPNSPATEEEANQEGGFPSNFHTHIYLNGKWQGPVNVTQVVVPSATTVDARFFTTPKGTPLSVGHSLESDLGNPNVLFVTWGEIGWVIDGQDGLGKAETDLFYKRALYDATNKVWVWDTNSSKLSAIAGGVVEEKEVESLASPDGKTIYNVWLQESDPDVVQQYETQKDINISDNAEGVDSWFGRIDYNISNVPPVVVP